MARRSISAALNIELGRSCCCNSLVKTHCQPRLSPKQLNHGAIPSRDQHLGNPIVGAESCFHSGMVEGRITVYAPSLTPEELAVSEVISKTTYMN